MLNVGLAYDGEFNDLYNKMNNSKYGKQLIDVFGISRKKLDVATMSKLYFSDTEDDKTIDINSNTGRVKNPNNYFSEVYKGMSKLNSVYLLWKHVKKEMCLDKANNIIRNLLRGDYYFHDLTGAGVTAPYCFAWSSANVMVDGRQYGQLHSNVPKRSDSFIAVCIESVFELSQEQMGALAIPDFLVNLAWYYNKEGVDPIIDKYSIQNDFQRLIHSLNQQFRVSCQSAFTNFSIFDREVFKKTFDEYYYPDGTKSTDLIEYIMEIQYLFMDFMSKKDPSSKLPYRFPVTTLNLYVDEATNKVVDDDFLKRACEYNTEGIFNIFISKGVAKLCSCCRLVQNPQDLLEYSRFDSFANNGVSLGSARVVTVNFARIGKLANKDREKYKSILCKRLEEVRILLRVQRHILKKKIDEGYLKFFKLGWMNLSRFFSTFGVNGLYESLLFMDLDIQTDEGIEFTKEIFKFIEHKLYEFSKEDGIAYNLEQVPAEGAASVLAKMDKIYFDNENYPFEIYANQFIPLWKDVDIVERAETDGKIGKFMSGGSICHLNILSKTSPEQMKKLIDFAISCDLEHFALNPSFSVCENGCVSLGDINTTVCPTCGGNIKDHLTRVVGYFVPVSNMDKMRRELDAPNRKFQNLDL